MIAETLEQTLSRFWSKVRPAGPEECWLWLGGGRPNSMGVMYGRFNVASSTVSAHRYAYEMLRGPIGKGLVIDHLCRVPRCVNPKHMEVVTTEVNVLRGVGRGANNRRKDKCHRGHPFDEKNTYWLPSGAGRSCRACQYERGRTFWEKRKAFIQASKLR